MTRTERVAFTLFAVGGIGFSLATDPGVTRPWFAAVAACACWCFVAVYARRPWRDTYAGRAAMLMTLMVALVTTNASAILWWSGDGYPLWQSVTELLYLGIALASLYKLRALARAEPPSDPTV